MARLTNIMHSRGAAIAAMLLGMAAMAVAFSRGSANLAEASPSFVALAVAAYLALIALWLYLYHRFNVLRSLTSLSATLSVVMLMATPWVMGTLYAGTLLLALSLAATALLFGIFDQPHGQRPLFLAFALFSAASLWRLQFAFFIPLLLLAIWQMRILSPRSLCAALLGLITPWWLAAGCYLVINWHTAQTGSLHLPDMQALLDMPRIMPSSLRQWLVIGFTALAAIVFATINLVKILSYNARVRAFNGLLTLWLVVTIALAAADFRHLLFYIPLLYSLAAYQMAHFFTYRRARRSYIAILSLIALYLAAYIWAVI